MSPAAESFRISSWKGKHEPSSQLYFQRSCPHVPEIPPWPRGPPAAHGGRRGHPAHHHPRQPGLREPLASGTALLNALAAITDAGAFKSYVIKLDPGGYNVWTTQLVMKPHVDIEGSGQGSTSVEGLGNADGSYLTGIIQAAPQAELRNLQVASTGSGQTTSIGVYVPSGANTSLRDLTITVGGATNN
jgi:hypothetical protein